MKVERLLAIGIVAVVMALGWTQFSRAQTAPGGTGAHDITPTEEPAASPWGWLKMPTITMPKISMPKMPADPLAPIKTSARKVGDGTKKAWEGTKEIFTFGGSKKDESATRVASNGESPSLMQRMFGGGEEEKPAEGPATVGEWMSQSRVE
jgi:hypothetical protein